MNNEFFETPVGKKLLKELQAVIDDAKNDPAISEYVKERKLSLIDSRYELADKLLEAGLLH